jgi:hypothetical protein
MGETRNACNTLVRNPERMVCLGKPRDKWILKK